MFIVQRYLSKLFHFLQKPPAVKWQIVFYMVSFSCYGRVRADYERTYGRAIASEAIECQLEAAANFPPDNKPDPSAKKQVSMQCEWSRFPEYPIYLYLLRKLSTIWMCYIVIRYSLGHELIELVRQTSLMDLPLPNHCYLLGRFIFAESIADLLAAFFSFLFLINRFYVTVGPPTRSNLIYLLLLDEHDTELIYSRFSRRSRKSIASFGYSKQLTAREQLLLDTMCFRIHYPSRVAYELRANRTAEANLALRKCVAKMSIIAISVIIPVALVLGSYDMVQYLLDSRYLHTYPNCDPKLELLRSEGKLQAESSMTMSQNHVISIPFDILENCILWIECGLTATIVPSIVHLVNYDLVLHWAGINRKIYQLETIVRPEADQDECYRPALELTHKRLSSISCGYEFSQLRTRDFEMRYELVAEMNDFFTQVQQSSKFIAYILNFTVIGSLSMTSLMTYQLRKKSLHQVPWQLLIISTVIVLALCLGSYSCMLVHNACQKSYTRFCSLVANDPMKHKVRYGTLIEHYREHKDCYKLMNMYSFLPSTLLTFVGWFISCFVIVSEVLGRSLR